MESFQLLTEKSFHLFLKDRRDENKDSLLIKCDWCCRLV